MRHPVHVLQVFGKCLALGHREYVADIREELHHALGGLVSQLQVFGARGLQRAAIDRGLLQRLHGVGMGRTQLRMQGHQVV